MALAALKAVYSSMSLPEFASKPTVQVRVTT
jgi:hypothetical protein